MALENVNIMPLWNQRSSAAERFEELAVMARKNPEKFERVIAIWHHVKDNAEGTKVSCTNYALVGVESTLEAYGLVELGRAEIFSVVKGV